MTRQLRNGEQARHEDLRESVECWVREISAKCRAYGMPAGVVLAVVPFDDPRPTWATNIVSPEHTKAVLRSVTEAVGQRIVAAGPLAKG